MKDSEVQHRLHVDRLVDFVASYDSMCNRTMFLILLMSRPYCVNTAV